MIKDSIRIDQEQLEVQLDVMLQMQNALNRLVIPDWRQKALAWHRAIYVEAAEYLEHLGSWKWWKKGTPNFPQANMELVDIWHFGLSWYLTNRLSETTRPSMSEIERLGLMHIMSNDILAANSYEPLSKAEPTANEQRHVAVDELVAAAGAKKFSMSAFVRLLAYSGMDFDMLYQRYIGKNVLNRFRQEHGYKTGEYVKVWAGLEDNEHLDRLLAELPADISLPDRVHAGLTELYANVVKTQA